MKPTKLLPEQIKDPLWQIKGFVNSIVYYGKERYCPICNKSFRKFGKIGIIPRKDAICLRCDSLERHRLVWLYFKKMTDILDGRPKKVLHVAPERSIENRLKNMIGEGYLTAGLFDPRAMVKMDITNIQYPDEVFDVIYCSHVLEHVPDDRKAIREFHRVLKPDGWAILLVPITTDETFEDPSITDPTERLRLFGHPDHVRRYGLDYINRLIEVGFKVDVFTASDFLSDKEILHMGISNRGGEIYYCTKQY